MPNALANLFSWADGVKRRVSSPLQTIALGLQRGTEDLAAAGQDMDTAYGRNGMNSVLITAQQRAQAAQRSAEFGANMGLGAATVWHGSPHKFDKFDSSKIGTGEGSQAYGHGLYVAESPTVARSYQAMANNPARRQGPVGEGREKVVLDSLIKLNAKKYAGGDVAKLAELVKSRPRAFSDPEGMLARISEYEGNLAPSYLYKADLPDSAIAKMLNYESPVPANQLKSISDAAMKDFGSGATGTSGEHLYKEIVFNFKQSGHPNPTQAATDWLAKQGVPGMRHFDAGSRNTGAGTSNFVVFPGQEDILKILERNGVPTK